MTTEPKKDGMRKKIIKAYLNDWNAHSCEAHAKGVECCLAREQEFIIGLFDDYAKASREEALKDLVERFGMFDKNNIGSSTLIQVSKVIELIESIRNPKSK